MTVLESLDQPTNWAHIAAESSYHRQEARMRQPYETPALVDYGPIADCTFVHPRHHHHLSHHWYAEFFQDEGVSGLPVPT